MSNLIIKFDGGFHRKKTLKKAGRSIAPFLCAVLLMLSFLFDLEPFTGGIGGLEVLAEDMNSKAQDDNEIVLLAEDGSGETSNDDELSEEIEREMEKEKLENVSELIKSMLGKSEDMGYSAFLYNEENGLPTSEATGIVQTDDGFIWIGGYGGLTRYDGTEFERFDSTTGITTVASLFKDSNDVVWVGLNDKGLAKYQDNGFLFYTMNDGLTSGSIRSISEDDAGNIILATTRGINYITPDGTIGNIRDDRVIDKYIAEIVKGSAGMLYVIGNDGSVTMMKDLKIVDYYEPHAFTDDLIISIHPSNFEENVLYAGTSKNELLKIYLSESENGEPKVISYPTGNLLKINDVTELNENYKILCADNGIGYMDSKYNIYEIDNLPMTSSIDGFISDYEGNLWFTSARQGVMKIVLNRFKDINGISGLGDMVVNTTCIRDGLLYIGADTGLYILKKDTLEIVENDLTEYLAGVRIRSIIKDSKNDLWICSYGSNMGLVCVTSDGKRYSINEDTGLNSNRVRSCLELSDGRMVVTSKNGVNIIENGKVVKSYGSEEGLLNTEILCCEENSDGRIFVGSDGGGIYIIDGDNVENITTDDGLNSGVVMKIRYDDENKCLWLVTGNNIAYYKDGTVNNVTEYPYSNNFDIFFNKYKQAWVLSSAGIYVTDTSSLIDNSNIEYSVLNYSQGLSSSITANSRSYIDEEGVLYICGAHGVYSVNMNNDIFMSSFIKLDISSIDVDGKTFYLNDYGEITIPASSKRVSIKPRIMVNSLNDPKVGIRLEGLDNEVEITKNSAVSTCQYTNLAGGKYIFHLYVYDSQTGEVIAEKSLTINKIRKLRELTWFRILIAAVVLLLAVTITYSSIKNKMKRLEKKNEMNKLFISQIIGALATAVDQKDKYTKGHSQRVAQYSKQIAEKLGYGVNVVEDIYNCALLHDIGKLTIPDGVLNKNGKLTEEEYAIMKTHSQKGYEILREITSFPDLGKGARYHHERIDGKGYPLGLTGDKIPDVAKIIAVADTFDAMNSNRVYRKKLTTEAILAELKRVAGTQLDEEKVKAILELIDEGKIKME